MGAAYPSLKKRRNTSSYTNPSHSLMYIVTKDKGVSISLQLSDRVSKDSLPTASLTVNE